MHSSQIISLALGCRSSMIYYAVKIHQLSPAQHITGGNYSGVASQPHTAKLQRCRCTDDAQVVKWVTFSVRVKQNNSVFDSKAILTCKMTSCHITYLPYGELTVQHLPDLTQFGSMK